MCGIAGYSLAPGVQLPRTALAQLLLAGVAERGRDATGYAYATRDDATVRIHKSSRALEEAIGDVEVPPDASCVILHVRDFTKGVPGINDNNHPIRYGATVGVHNGYITNDDALFMDLGMPRSTPQITVDSEAIMMLVDVLGDVATALERVRGAAAVAILRDEAPERLTIAKRSSRTVHVAEADGLVCFASTREPLELAQQALRRSLCIRQLKDGTLLEIEAGRVVTRRRFCVDFRHAGKRLVRYPPIAEKRALIARSLAAFSAS